jgi:hypothetical protein
MLVTVTIVLGGRGTCNETRREIGDTIAFRITIPFRIALTAFAFALIAALKFFVLELTTIGIVRIDEALE